MGREKCIKDFAPIRHIFELGGISMQKLAIFGGSFDPVHCGHLAIAQVALTQLNLDQVLWVPTRQPPHKIGRSLLDFDLRKQMIQLAIAYQPAFELSLVEANRTPPSYAIQTLTELQAIYGNAQWFWIVGADTFATLPRWYESEQLAALVEWLVAPRSLPATSALAALNWSDFCQQVARHWSDSRPRVPLRWQVLQMPMIDISSSLIRQYCRARRSIRHLVPESVSIYIETHHLYQGDSN